MKRGQLVGGGLRHFQRPQQQGFIKHEIETVHTSEVHRTQPNIKDCLRWGTVHLKPLHELTEELRCGDVDPLKDERLILDGAEEAARWQQSSAKSQDR